MATLDRPIQHLYPLEVFADKSPAAEPENNSEDRPNSEPEQESHDPKGRPQTKLVTGYWYKPFLNGTMKFNSNSKPASVIGTIIEVPSTC